MKVMRLAKESTGIYFLDGWENKFNHENKILGFLYIEKEWLTGQRFLLSGSCCRWRVGENGALVYVGS